MTAAGELDAPQAPSGLDSFNIAVVQTESRPGQWQRNIDEVAVTVRRLADEGSDIIVLPEFFATGYDLDGDMPSIAEEVPGRTSDALAELSAETGAVLVTALPHRTPDGTITDSSLVVGPDGLLALGQKRFLWGQENSVFTPGAQSGLLVPTPFGTIGVVICYEAGFPETVRDLARRGADVIAIPSAFGHPRLHVWKLLTRSRALENGVVVAAAGLTGRTGAGPRFAGHSVIVGPRGHTIAELDESAGAVAAVVARDALSEARREVPYLTDLQRLGGIAESTSTTEKTLERN